MASTFITVTVSLAVSLCGCTSAEESDRSSTGGGKADELGCEVAPPSIDEECFEIYLDARAVRSDAPEDVVCATEATDDPVAAAVIQLATGQYRADFELGDEIEIAASAEVWQNPFASTAWRTAGRVEVSSEGLPARTYELAQASTTQWLFSVTESSKVSLPCSEL